MSENKDSHNAAPEGVAHPRAIRSFVRRAGRTTIGQARAFETLGPRFLLPYAPAPLDFAAAFGRQAPTVLEIGFGMGEATAHIAGVRPGDHVGLLMANYPEFVAAKFAISRAGAVAVPVNFLNRRDELGYVLHQSDAVMLLTMDRFRGLDYLQFLDELAPGWESRGGDEAFPKLRQVVVMPTGGASRLRPAACSSAGRAGSPSGGVRKTHRLLVSCPSQRSGPAPSAPPPLRR